MVLSVLNITLRLEWRYLRYWGKKTNFSSISETLDRLCLDYLYAAQISGSPKWSVCWSEWLIVQPFWLGLVLSAALWRHIRPRGGLWLVAASYNHSTYIWFLEPLYFHHHGVFCRVHIGWKINQIKYLPSKFDVSNLLEIDSVEIRFVVGCSHLQTSCKKNNVFA